MESSIQSNLSIECVSIVDSIKCFGTKFVFLYIFRNETKPIALEELSLFINALSASCEDPRNFYGEDLVNVLRLRTNNIEASSVISPFVFLTLCLNNVTTDMDVVKIRDFVHNEHHTREFGKSELLELFLHFTNVPILLNLPTPIIVSLNMQWRVI